MIMELRAMDLGALANVERCFDRVDMLRVQCLRHRPEQANRIVSMARDVLNALSRFITLASSLRVTKAC